MKKFLASFLLFVISMIAYSQSRNYYYQHGGMLYNVSFGNDNENDYVADAFCGNMVYKFGYKGKDSRGQLKFQSFTFVAEQKMVRTIYSPLPVPQMTGRVVKSYTSNWMYVSPDYKTMILNGVGYVQISKEKYDLIKSSSYQVGANNVMTDSYQSKRSSTNNRSSSRSEWKQCPDCGGTGDCKVCHGYGKSIYDAYYTGNGKFVSECWYCGGYTKCTTCHGQKRIRIR